MHTQSLQFSIYILYTIIAVNYVINSLIGGILTVAIGSELVDSDNLLNLTVIMK